MTTISTVEAETHLSRYLAAVEKGEEFVIARGQQPVARLVPVARTRRGPRPRLDEVPREEFKVPDEAFAPLTDAELEEWGL